MQLFQSSVELGFGIGRQSSSDHNRGTSKYCSVPFLSCLALCTLFIPMTVLTCSGAVDWVQRHAGRLNLRPCVLTQSITDAAPAIAVSRRQVLTVQNTNGNQCREVQ